MSSRAREEVETRPQFIEENARYVKNLDV